MRQVNGLMLFSYRYYLIRFYKICLDILYESFFFWQVMLLDLKKSMNVNIFLKQFWKFIEVIIDFLRVGDLWVFGVEKLKGLFKVFLQIDEVGVVGDLLLLFSMVVVYLIFCNYLMGLMNVLILLQFFLEEEFNKKIQKKIKILR